MWTVFLIASIAVVAITGADGYATGGEFICPEPDGLYPHPTDRNKFYVCTGNVSRLESCQTGLVFNATDKVCEEENCSEGFCVCRLDIDPGCGDDAFLRYFYNTNSGRCEVFTYTGCAGNRNNFESITKCENSCIKTQGCSPNIKCPPQTVLFAYEYNRNKFCLCHKGILSLEKCQPGLVFNPVDSICEDEYCPEGKCVCQLERDDGPCGDDDYNLRFFFNKKTRQCEVFRYTSCGGNRNNFKTQNECGDTCISSTDRFRNFATPDFLCPQENGVFPHESDKHMYYLCVKDEPSLKTCKDLVFNPESKICFDEGCPEGKCVCQLKKDPGPCSTPVRRFYFNTETNSCEQFQYSGCVGNGNNFKTRRECELGCEE